MKLLPRTLAAVCAALAAALAVGAALHSAPGQVPRPRLVVFEMFNSPG